MAHVKIQLSFPLQSRKEKSHLSREGKKSVVQNDICRKQYGHIGSLLMSLSFVVHQSFCLRSLV